MFFIDPVNDKRLEHHNKNKSVMIADLQNNTEYSYK